MRPAPPYQDLLRAVGLLLDRDGWRDIALTEEPAGLTVRGTRPAETGRVEADLHLTLDELGRLLVAARHRRGRAATASSAAGAGPGYQARLRAVGWLAEVAGLRGLRVVEAGNDLLVQGWPIGSVATGRRWVVRKRLTPADIAALLHQLGRIGRRGIGRPHGE